MNIEQFYEYLEDRWRSRGFSVFCSGDILTSIQPTDDYHHQLVVEFDGHGYHKKPDFNYILEKLNDFRGHPMTKALECEICQFFDSHEKSYKLSCKGCNYDPPPSVSFDYTRGSIVIDYDWKVSQPAEDLCSPRDARF